MMMQRLCSFLIAVAVSTLSLSSALADDLFPPPWRGDPLTTVAEWDFFSDTGLGNSVLPDGVTVPPVVGDGGNAQGTGDPLVTPIGDLVWDPWDGDGAWISNSGGELIFDIPNWIDLEPVKLISVQITMQPQGSNPPRPEVTSVTGFDSVSPVVTSQLIDIFETPPDINGIVLRQEHWAMFPNPDYEQIVITLPPDTLVDQVVIDTISGDFGIPEPSTLALAGLGLLSITVLRRKRF